MGKFFKALEQAERERSLRQEALRRPSPAESSVSAPPREAGSLGATTPRFQRTAEPRTAVPGESAFQRPTVREAAPSQSDPRGVLAPAPATPAVPNGKVDDHLVSLLAPSSFEAEQYRTLRHRVEALHNDANLSVIAVTSPEAGDGKTITAINLAGALAQSPGARILIVDVDMRRSAITEYLGLDDPRARGLVGAILDNRLSLKDVVEPRPPFNLSVVRAGRQSVSPYEILKSPRLGRLLEEARQQYDYVILDTPPLLPLPDCSVIGPLVDGFLVVVAAHKTQRRLFNEAMAILDRQKIIGLVFNQDDKPHVGYYGYARSAWGDGPNGDDKAR